MANYDAMFHSDFSMAIMYSYRMGFGDFNTDNFDFSVDRSLWYVFFVS
jgi:hypothetical protein